jgi:hypothetical protein
MAGQPLVSDYISIILRAINQAQNDPAHMRRLIYDLARISVGRQLLLSYEEIGSNGIQRHVSDLEAAIKQAEILSSLEGDLLSDPGSAPSLAAGKAGAEKALLISEPSPPTDNKNDGGAVAVLPSFLAPSDDHKLPLPPQSHQAVTTEIWDAVPRTSKGRVPKSQLLMAAAAGLAIYALTLSWPDLIIDLRIPYVSKLVQQVSYNPGSTIREPSKQTSAAGAGTPLASDKAKSPGFPLPAVYGVYALSRGKLYGLQPLAMKVPDPRVAISAMIANPSRVTLPDGKLSFIVYRRDLQSSAPDTVPVRVVARVMREIKFAANGPAKTVDIDGEWAIRSKSYEFGVAPIDNKPEMIMLLPHDPRFSFPPGRYALVFRGEGYDFNVAGQLTDTAQCLERTDALGGMVYSECRDMPRQPR